MRITVSNGRSYESHRPDGNGPSVPAPVVLADRDNRSRRWPAETVDALLAVTSPEEDR